MNNSNMNEPGTLKTQSVGPQGLSTHRSLKESLVGLQDVHENHGTGNLNKIKSVYVLWSKLTKAKAFISF